MLDFQDAGLGPLPYDIASLCETVRRDGGLEIMDEVITCYAKQNPVMTLNELRSACRLLAAQRHMRILGIIKQLAEKQGRHDKLAYIPRIWKTLHHLLQDQSLAPVKLWLDTHLPTHERI